jgi:hypothetical protein
MQCDSWTCLSHHYTLRYDAAVTRHTLTPSAVRTVFVGWLRRYLQVMTELLSFNSFYR